MITACPHCGTVHEDLARWQGEVNRLLRENSRLKTELAKQRDERPEAKAARELFDYWVQSLAKNEKTTKYTEDRQKLLLTALKTYTADELRKAFDGLALRPHAGARGRASAPYPGSRVHADIEHAISTAKRIEACWGYVDEAAETKDERYAKARDDMAKVYGTDTVTGETRWHATAVFPDLSRHPGGLDSVLEALARAGKDVVGSAPQLSAQCPAHDDRSPSLRIKEATDGRVLLFCQAGCKTLDVLHALGLEFADIGGPCGLNADAARRQGMLT